MVSKVRRYNSSRRYEAYYCDMLQDEAISVSHKAYRFVKYLQSAHPPNMIPPQVGDSLQVSVRILLLWRSLVSKGQTW